MRVTVQGKVTDDRTARMHAEVERLTGRSLRITQGSYNRSVGASAGTHDGGGVLDISVDGLGATAIQNVTAAYRTVGFAAWYRTPDDGFAPHLHVAAIGCTDLSPAAARQVTAYRNGRNGLANNGPDRQANLGVKPTTWEAYSLQHRTPYPLAWPREFGYRAGTRGPWRLLLTDRGPHVRRINELLLGSTSSEYTARTASAVRTWQGKRAMPITGRVGRREYERMGL